MLIRLSSAIAALALATSAGAATLSGTIFDDPRCYALRSDFRPLGAASVTLYRDGGERLATTHAESNGVYSFG